MSVHITNGELLELIHNRGDLQNKATTLNSKYAELAATLKKEEGLKIKVDELRLILKNVYEVKIKSESWRNRVRFFELEGIKLREKRCRASSDCAAENTPSPSGRTRSCLSDSPCGRVERNILKQCLAVISSTADEHGIGKEELLVKIVQEAIRSRDWETSTFRGVLQATSSIPVDEQTALIYAANFSQRQYQMCRNLLTRYGVKALQTRSAIDEYKKTLYPTITVDALSASVSVKQLFDSTLQGIVESEGLVDKLNELPSDASVEFTLKAGLDGSGSHKKRQQLSGDPDDDSLQGSSDNFLGVFMTPMKISASSAHLSVALWENPHPNSISFTRPIMLMKSKESRELVEAIFPALQSQFDELCTPHDVVGVSKLVSTRTKVTMIDGKMVNLVQGDSGAFCHYCDISQSQASSLQFLTSSGVGGMHITKTNEECRNRWELVESGEIAYNNPQRPGQCHKPLLTESGRLFAILHQEIRSLDFALKILYHLVAGQKVWSEANPVVKASVAEGKARVIKHIQSACGGC
eukprot:Seg5140.1 transcript_id=Seg5140.1/GoldUCD/mRNA.D3Y31 product="hypothetical protein" protein_id=Seg5140.1/GoldUCD/D3Y31